MSLFISMSYLFFNNSCVFELQPFYHDLEGLPHYGQQSWVCDEFLKEEM